MKTLGFVLVAAVISASCVSKKLYNGTHARALQLENELEQCDEVVKDLNGQLRDMNNELAMCQTAWANEKNRVHSLEQQLDYFKNTNTNLLERLTDLSVVNKTGAESIKKSLEALNDQNRYIKDLNTSIRTRDSINLALVMNLKRSLSDINDEDVNIEIKKGVVYISLSDKLLFRSGSSEISKQAEAVLGKIAKVLNDHNHLEILVEGHTDNVPIATSCIADNWDLSVKRATSVVRYLQQTHGLAPERMTAGGRSEYVTKTTNSTAEGRAINRRTEIIVLPQLDQFFELLAPPTASK